jgi:outer membrane cobalamin receptor
MARSRKTMPLSELCLVDESGCKRFQGFWKCVAGAFTLGFFFILFTGSVAADEEKPTGVGTVLEEITVTGERINDPATPVTTRYGTQYNLVSEEQIRQQDARDFQSTLRNVPGVMFQSKNLMGSQTSHSLYIRGRGASHPSSDFAVEFDGVPRYGAIFGQVLGDGIAVSTIEGVEVFKSPQPSQFGSGYASVNVLPRYLKEEGRELDLDLSVGSHATFGQAISGGVKKGPYDFFLSQSWGSTDGHRDHSRAQQQNYYANTGYRLNEAWDIRLLANYVSSQTLAPKPDVAPNATNGVAWPGAERYDTETFLTTLTLSHRYDDFSGYLKIYQNETDFDLLQELNNGVRYGGGTGGLWSRQEISLYGIRAREILNPWPGGEIIAGADLDKTELKNTQRTYTGLAAPGINGGLAERVWNYPDTTLISPYLAVSQYMGRQEDFHVIPSAGFRYFKHDEFKDESSSQVGLVAGCNHTDLNFNYARGITYPSPVVVMNAVVTDSAVTDPDQFWREIKPEVVDHYEVGLTHTWPELASLGATIFQDKGKDRFRTYMFGPVPTLFNDPIGNYRIRGLELSGSITPGESLECFAGATWLDVKATGSDGIEQDKMPYTPSFQLQAGVTLKFMENFKFYADMQHLRGVYQGTVFRTRGFDFGQLTEKDKLDDITLFNTRIAYTFDYQPWRLKDSEIFLAVNNVFDRDYEYAKGYGMPGATVFAGLNIRFR